MKAFMAAGCLIRMALAAAEPSSGLVGASFAPGLEAWDLLADVVTAALLSSKHQFLEGMLSELDQLCYVTGAAVAVAGHCLQRAARRHCNEPSLNERRWPDCLQA
jgi:hypothetical protein